jgi:hypothetical protein
MTRGELGSSSSFQHIRGLGFIGLLVSGSHHQPHHLAIAKGEFDHEHLGQTHRMNWIVRYHNLTVWPSNSQRGVDNAARLFRPIDAIPNRRE